MQKKRNNPLLRTVLRILIICITVAVIIYLITHGRRYFSRRSIRQMQSVIHSYGTWSPLAVFFLIFISTLIPPLPLPIPIIELAAGYLYGFGPGFIVIWISQIISSLSAYGVSRYFGKKILKPLLKYRIISFYQEYLKEKGAIAVLISRSTMSSPFNVVSFLSGFTQMSMSKFTGATILGTLPESVLFSYIGSLVQHTRFRLWYVFILLVLLGITGPLLTYIVMKVEKRRLK